MPWINLTLRRGAISKQMQHAAIIRSMNTPEGAHARAKYYMHTGYREGIGGLAYPSLGAIASAEISHIATLQPSAASWRASSRPMPVPPPVITAIFPAKSFIEIAAPLFSVVVVSRAARRAPAKSSILPPPVKRCRDGMAAHAMFATRKNARCYTPPPQHVCR